MSDFNKRYCPICGRTLEEGEICSCQGKEKGEKENSLSVSLKEALKDFEDYLDDKIAPALVSGSLSYILQTSSSAPMTPDEIAEFVYEWAKKKASSSDEKMVSLLLFALGAIVKADRFGILDSFDGSLFYSSFILKLVGYLPSEQIESFKDSLRTKQENVWKKFISPEREIDEKSKKEPRATPAHIPEKEIPYWEQLLSGIMERKTECDKLLEEGDTDYHNLFTELDNKIKETIGFGEAVKPLRSMKKAAIELFNNKQILGAWMLAKVVDREMYNRNNELIVRMVYEAGSAEELSEEQLKEFLKETIFYPLIAPICRMFAEYSPGELLLRLMNEEDQSTRRFYYNLLKVQGEHIFPILIEQLQNPSNYPWYYIRNVAAILGEFNNLDQKKRSIALNELSKYVALQYRRQLVTTCIHSIARINSQMAEKILLNLLSVKPLDISDHEKEGQYFTPLEFGCKLIEGLCMLNTQKSIDEVVNIAFGGKKPITSHHESLQYFALEQLSRIDLNLHPLIKNRVVQRIIDEIVKSKFSIKKIIKGRSTRWESALVYTLRHTPGNDTMAVLQKILESNASLDAREAARHILEEQDKEKEDRIISMFPVGEEFSDG